MSTRCGNLSLMLTGDDAKANRPAQPVKMLLNVLPGFSPGDGDGDRDACSSMATWLRPDLRADLSKVSRDVNTLCV